MGNANSQSEEVHDAIRRPPKQGQVVVNKATPQKVTPAAKNVASPDKTVSTPSSSTNSESEIIHNKSSTTPTPPANELPAQLPTIMDAVNDFDLHCVKDLSKTTSIYTAQHRTIVGQRFMIKKTVCSKDETDIYEKINKLTINEERVLNDLDCMYYYNPNTMAMLMGDADDTENTIPGHPNILRFHSVLNQSTDSEHNIFCLYEYLDNYPYNEDRANSLAFVKDGLHNYVTLEDAIALQAESGSQFSEQRIWSWLLQLMDAVTYVHSMGYVHSNLTTDSILLTNANSKIKIANFGYAFSADESRDGSAPFGNPFFCAPELFEARHCGDRIDTWAIGCILFNMLTLKRVALAYTLPFDAAYLDIAVTELKKTFSEKLCKLLQCMLVVDPAVRPSVTELRRKFFARDIHSEFEIENITVPTCEPRFIVPPAFMEHFMDYGNMCMENGLYTEAIYTFESLEYNNTDWGITEKLCEAYYTRGLMRLERKQYAKAKQDFEACEMRIPGYGDVAKQFEELNSLLNPQQSDVPANEQH